MLFNSKTPTPRLYKALKDYPFLNAKVDDVLAMTDVSADEFGMDQLCVDGVFVLLSED